jgi:hypothetical protein
MRKPKSLPAITTICESKRGVDANEIVAILATINEL